MQGQKDLGLGCLARIIAVVIILFVEAFLVSVAHRAGISGPETIIGFLVFSALNIAVGAIFFLDV